jgi:type II secretory pathway pseudopilin PulG
VHLIRARARAQEGFAMVTVLAVMLVASIVAVAAVSAAENDRVTTTRDKERKQAYAAAEAGVNDYLARLVANVDYWRKCGTDANNPSLNQRLAGDDPTRKWATVPKSDARYSVEVLPANGAAQCDTNNAQTTFIDTDTGTFRVRSTGRVGEDGDKRTVVATFKRRGFLDYVYFTDYETSSPGWFRRASNGQDTRQNPAPATGSRTIEAWADAECKKYYRAGGQSAVYANGQRNNNGTWTNMDPDPACGEIQFVTGDSQNGPFHTNDEILVCGSPRFGRKPTDDIEISAPDGVAGGVGSASGWRACNGGGAPQVNDPATATPDKTLGTLRKGSPTVEMPPSNKTLKNLAARTYRFKGKTRIKFEGTVIRALEPLKRENGTTVAQNATIPLPKDGVIWVANDPAASCTKYDPQAAETAAQPGCGDLWVQGDYDSSVTLGAENDIVIENSITRDDSDDVLLGLIADQWIRVYHPARNVTANDCDNNGGPSGGITIKAALLALNHSFTVDRYWCGSKLGNLTVHGAIAQKFRGPVGTSANTGYFKNYNYDDRLRFRTPPHFLDPVQASWKIQSQVEQVPAT